MEEARTITVANMHLDTRKIPTARKSFAPMAHQIHLHHFSGVLSNFDRDLGELGSTCSDAPADVAKT